MQLDEVRASAARIAAWLGLRGSLVGVRLLAPGEEPPGGAEVLHHHRYCQAVTRARHGASVLLGREGISCPAAARAFGFRVLPEQLQSGKGLVGFGIVSDPAVGQRMFEGMSTLAPGSVAALHLFPLDRAEHAPDVVVVEDEVEKLMWLALASLHATGGARVQSSTAVLQATCVDATILPYLEHRMNLSYGCYGCREATDIGQDEAVLGFPAALLPGIASHVEFLARRAIPAARAKGAWRALDQERQRGG